MRFFLLAILLSVSLHAAITRTARGTNASTANNATITVASVTTATGSTLVVCAYSGEQTRTGSSVSWNSQTFAKDDGVQNGVTTEECWRAHNVSNGASGTLTFTWSGTTRIKSIFVTELSGSNGVLSDAASNTGTGSTNPATTGSVTCTPNAGGDCVWIAGLGVLRNNTDAAPTWTNPNSAGQKDGGTGGYDAEGFEIDSGAVTQAGDATMATAATYGMVLVSYTEPAAATPRRMMLLGVGP